MPPARSVARDQAEEVQQSTPSHRGAAGDNVATEDIQGVSLSGMRTGRPRVGDSFGIPTWVPSGTGEASQSDHRNPAVMAPVAYEDRPCDVRRPARGEERVHCRDLVSRSGPVEEQPGRVLPPGLLVVDDRAGRARLDPSGRHGVDPDPVVREAEVEAVLTIAPPPVRDITRAAAWMIENSPVTLTASVACMCSIGVSGDGLFWYGNGSVDASARACVGRRPAPRAGTIPAWHESSSAAQLGTMR